MVTTTYLLLVAVLGIVAWRFSARSTRTVGRRWRTVLTGVGGDDDLVERMATRLVECTVAFGSSHAVPEHLGAQLPPGVFEAATAARAQLTAEVVDRYCALMDERCRRLHRPEFVLPDGYTLDLALVAGTEEALPASFEAVSTVRADAGVRGRAVPVPVGAAPGRPALRVRSGAGRPGRAALPDELDEVTVRRLGRDRAGGHTVFLDVAGTRIAQRRLGADDAAVEIGRGCETALRCPDEVEDVSRRHALLTWVDGRCYVEDTYSANGTWLSRADGEPVALVPGEPTPWSPGDVVWLDEDRRTAVTLR